VLQSLSVSLLYTSGPVQQPPLLRLALSLAGAPFPSGTRARGSAAVRERGFADFDLSAGDFDALRRAAEAAGFDRRVPRVEAVVDTSDSAAGLVLRVEHERGAFTLSLGLMCSGYDGPDAPALKAFLSLLLAKAGVRDPSILHDLAGA